MAHLLTHPEAIRTMAQAHELMARALRIQADEAAKPPPEPAPPPPLDERLGFVTVNQWAQRHPWPSASGMRAIVFNAAHNGFERCLRRIGRRVLINEALALEWIAGDTAQPVPKAPRKGRVNKGLKPEFHPDRVLQRRVA